MFKGKENLRSEGERVEMTPELQKEWIRCAQDLIYFCENYFKIITLDEGPQLFIPYNYQKKALKVFVSNPNGLPHVIGLWPRQQGKTTVVSAYLLHYALFNDNVGCAILANKDETATEIMTRIKFAYENLPLWLQQGIKTNGWNAKSIKLGNGSSLFSTTTSSGSISGKSISRLYIDEFSKIPEHVAQDFIASTWPVISSGKKTKIIITSTPKGLNHFYQFWKNAVDEKNNFFPMKVRWQDHPDRDKAWKKKTLQELNNNKILFNQEYLCKFIGSNSTLIDADILTDFESKEPSSFKWEGAFLIYEEPKPDCLYILGIDSGKGIGSDASVIQVLKIEHEYSIKQVAAYRANTLSTYDFAQICISVSQFYNGALMMIENNGIGGEVAQTIWYEYEYDKICNIDKNGLGINANKKSKLNACMLLKEYAEKGWLELVDYQTIWELSRFVEVRPNIFQCETNHGHDDTVTALYWGLWFLKTPLFDDKDVSVKRLQEKFRLKNNEDTSPAMIFDDGGVHTNQIYDENLDWINF